MEVTRGYWSVVGIGGALAALSVFFDRPLLLGGTVVLWGWLVGLQYSFLRTAEQVRAETAVDVSTSRSRVVTDTTTTVTLRATGADRREVEMTVGLSIPLSATDRSEGDGTLSVKEGPTTATRVIEWPLAGEFELGPLELTVRDSTGLFVQRFKQSGYTAVVVDPRRPRNVHVGAGGSSVGGVYGEHDTDRIGSGIEPAELRQYVAGDAAKDIDWKATARLNTPHVREQEATTDRQTVVVLDHRRTVGDGRAGETKLEYLRHVALAFIDSADELNDPLGLYTVGDDGITTSIRPATDTATYDRVRTAVRQLSPTGTNERPHRANGRTVTYPAAARRAAQRLTTDASSMSDPLVPFLEAGQRYVDRIDADPLFRTVRTHRKRTAGSVWTVIFSDDSNRAELRETVKLARGADDFVVVFLTPSVLFEEGGLSSLPGAYDGYVAFEEFRHELDRLDRVSAFEVCPGDRLDALLATDQRGAEAVEQGGVSGD
jgi:uncharacterized protein (DUF58 family)